MTHKSKAIPDLTVLTLHSFQKVPKRANQASFQPSCSSTIRPAFSATANTLQPLMIVQRIKELADLIYRKTPVLHPGKINSSTSCHRRQIASCIQQAIIQHDTFPNTSMGLSFAGFIDNGQDAMTPDRCFCTIF